MNLRDMMIGVGISRKSCLPFSGARVPSMRLALVGYGGVPHGYAVITVGGTLLYSKRATNGHLFTVDIT